MNPEWIILIISTGMLLGGVSLWQKNDRLLFHGKKTTAIVFANIQKVIGPTKGAYYPVIRFKTAAKVWITHEMELGYYPAVPEGKKIKIIYNPDDPHEVSMDSGLILVLIPRVLVALAIGGITYWLIVFLGYHSI